SWNDLPRAAADSSRNDRQSARAIIRDHTRNGGSTVSSNPSIRLLIAEDEKNLGLVLQKELSRLGHQVVLVHDAEAAIKTAREAEFDVALLDIMMPGRSVPEVLRALRHHE